jgi:hypothetical protein
MQAYARSAAVLQMPDFMNHGADGKDGAADQLPAL